MQTNQRSQTAQQVKGMAGEDEALIYLQQHGLSLVERNFRCKGGEIDLVMLDGSVVVFIEVRKRGSIRYGGAAASVTSAKQAKLITAAHVFLRRYAAMPACRFDVIAIDAEKLSWLKNAIEA